MSMLEIAMCKNHSLVFWQNNIRVAWQFFVIDPVTKTSYKKSLANKNLDFRVFPADTGHHPVADCRINNISHNEAVPE